MVDSNTVDVLEEPVEFGDGSRANPNIDPFENPEEMNQRYWSRWSWILVLIATLFVGFSLLFYGVFLAPQGKPIRQWMGIEQPVAEPYRLSQAAPPRAAAPASATDSAPASAPSPFLVAIQPTGSNGSDDKQKANSEPDDSDYGEKTYTVQLGDILSIVFPKDWKEVCEDNKRWLKGDCNHIYPEQVLTLREGVEPTEPSDRPKVVKAKMAEPPQRLTPVARGPRTNEAGEMLYTRVGVAPLNGCGRKDPRTISEEAWEELGLSEEDRVYLKLNADLDHGPRIDLTEAEGRIDMPSGMRLEQVTFCRAGKVIARGSYLTAWEDGHPPVKGQKFVLPSGLTAVWMRNCYNWVILIEEKKTPLASPPRITEETPVTPERPVVPPPAPSAPPSSIVPSPAVTTKHPVSCLEWAAIVGREEEPHYHGAANHANYLSADVRCVVLDNDDYRVSVGLGGTVVGWDGYDRFGGTYPGGFDLVGLSTKVVSHDGGWDATTRFPAFGHLKSEYHQGAFNSSREHQMWGFTASFNYFAPRLRGDENFYETQVNVAWAKPFGRADLSQYYFGQPLADHGQSTDYYLNVTVREYLRRLNENHELYGQVGLNVEKPFARSLSFRVGDAMYERCAGVGVGVDHDLITHSTVPAFGGWSDIPQCGVAYRTRIRAAQIIREAKQAGVNFDPSALGPAP